MDSRLSVVSVSALWLVKIEVWKLRIIPLHDDDVSTVVILRFMDEMMSLLASRYGVWP